MSREQILDKIRRSRRRPAELPAGIPEFPRYPDPVQNFRLEAERVGTKVLDGDNLAGALSRVLEDTGATRLYWQGESVLELVQGSVPFSTSDVQGDVQGSVPCSTSQAGAGSLVYSAHPKQSVRFPLQLEVEPYGRKTLAEVEVSVGLADWGIAETGTAAESTSRSAGRVLPILAPNHVQILSRSRITMNVAEFLGRVTLSRDESARVLMTGPSRTADIEKTLILGVHGPRRLYVILVP